MYKRQHRELELKLETKITFYFKTFLQTTNISYIQHFFMDYLKTGNFVERGTDVWTRGYLGRHCNTSVMPPPPFLLYFFVFVFKIASHVLAWVT
jgi:hypothetical protein